MSEKKRSVRDPVSPKLQADWLRCSGKVKGDGRCGRPAEFRVYGDDAERFLCWRCLEPQVRGTGVKLRLEVPV